MHSPQPHISAFVSAQHQPLSVVHDVVHVGFVCPASAVQVVYTFSHFFRLDHLVRWIMDVSTDDSIVSVLVCILHKVLFKTPYEHRSLLELHLYEL